MSAPDVTLRSLVAQLRSDAPDDLQFATRVAEACAVIADRAAELAAQSPGAAIRGVFLIAV